MRPSGAATWIIEEPDEGNLHVRVCGGIDMATYLILPGKRVGLIFASEAAAPLACASCLYFRVANRHPTR
jgi:hypothetical protein